MEFLETLNSNMDSYFLTLYQFRYIILFGFLIFLCFCLIRIFFLHYLGSDKPKDNNDNSSNID